MRTNQTMGEAVPDAPVEDLIALGAITLYQHGGGMRAVGAACISIALAVIVRLAQRLPKGAPERRVLAEAAKPLRDHLA